MADPQQVTGPPPRLAEFEQKTIIERSDRATVARAEHPRLPGVVVLKTYRRPLTGAERARFDAQCRLHEALAPATSVVRQIAYAAADDEPWVATEFQDEVLADLLEGRRLPADEAWTIGADLVTALAAVHARGHLHRDVNPNNVLVTGGRGFLTDFGLAVPAGAEVDDPAAGTEHYVAPELASGRQPSYRSDVYSAAVTLDRMFPEADRSAALRRLLDRATGDDPARRPADAGVLLAELTAARDAPADETGEAGVPAPRRRGRRLLAGTAVVLLAGFLTGGYLLLRDDDPPAACAAKTRPGTAVPVRSRLLTTEPGVARLSTTGPATRVDFPDHYTWAGLMLDLPAGVCRYRLDLEARLLAPARTMTAGEGWGYGLGPCNLWAGAQPLGYSLQYAAYQAPDGPYANSGVFHNPDVNNPQPVDVTFDVDYGWHRWTLEVTGDRVVLTREYGVATADGPVAGTTGLPATCDGAGVFLRVFNGSAEFRNILATAL